MKNFLYKELKLCISPINYLFILFTTMILIPNYPCYVPFFYISLSIFFIFNNAELNKDIQYSMILPITKKDIVKSRCLIIFSYEVICILFTIPFAILITKLVPAGNQAGINANVAFYGLLSIPLTAFNYIFLNCYYKKGEKPGLGFLFSSIAYWILYLILEFPIWTKNIFNIQFFQFIDSSEKADQIKQLPILAVGIIIFLVGWIITYKNAAKKFEKVDL